MCEAEEKLARINEQLDKLGAGSDAADEDGELPWLDEVGRIRWLLKRLLKVHEGELESVKKAWREEKASRKSTKKIKNLEEQVQTLEHSLEQARVALNHAGAPCADSLAERINLWHA